MPQVLKSFLTKYPLVQVNLEEKVSTAIIWGVDDNITNIGIFSQVPHGDGIEVYQFKTDELVLIVPREHPLAARSSVSFTEILDFEFVGLYVSVTMPIA